MGTMGTSSWAVPGLPMTRTPAHGAVPGPWIRPWLRLDTARSRVLTSTSVDPLHACAHYMAPWGISVLGLAYTGPAQLTTE
jgi:hypothetical protein